jgi:hypothetical protein
LYQFAEQSGFAQDPVADTINGREADASCSSAYAQALLAELAHPYALSARQMEFVSRWIVKWSRLAGICARPLPASAIPALAIDLAGDSGPTFLAECSPGATLRHLDLEEIGRTLRQNITLLKQGHTPAALGLGDDARPQGCENLLMLLYVQWCRAGTGRGEQRDAGEEKAQVCLGMHAAHYFIGGHAFRTPATGQSPEQERRAQLFSQLSARTERLLASVHSSAVESWRILNRSTSGFMCMQREQDAQLRIGHSQVIAMRRGASPSFHLGLVQWLRTENSGELHIGVRLFPGVARAMVVRPVNFHAPSGVNGFERALLLPEMTVPATPSTLVLPTGWYQPGRYVELFGEQKQIVKLVDVIEKGSDFDRCTIAFT